MYGALNAVQVLQYLSTKLKRFVLLGEMEIGIVPPVMRLCLPQRKNASSAIRLSLEHGVAVWEAFQALRMGQQRMNWQSLRA
jgi:hypothetical protein